MNETQVQEILDIERQKLAIHVAAAEMRMDDKDRASEQRMIEAITNVVTDAVVTLKAEMSLMRDELRGEIQDVRAELKADIHGLRAELKEEIQSVRTELKEEIQSVRTELKEEIQSVRTELKGDIARLERKLDNHTH
ncbi:hypothetical protein OUY22_24210 [Nonomuraea sp. MCN248]|uniref:DUF1640 domain-containing protein n=1 Tax=Nonomuraea corallina TaxID=2989783 RepID=A0ABT4SH37_9ACTN|nr:hypothetical protein [Nonomuraea corallina]MDA0636531.1 hypothetical protein [Nonomuraea corallina]